MKEHDQNLTSVSLPRSPLLQQIIFELEQKSGTASLCFSRQTQPEAPPPPSPVGSTSSYDGRPARPASVVACYFNQSGREKNHNSGDMKYNRGRKSRKSYRGGMNSFPFDLVPIWLDLLLPASS